MKIDGEVKFFVIISNLNPTFKNNTIISPSFSTSYSWNFLTNQQNHKLLWHDKGKRRLPYSALKIQ